MRGGDNDGDTGLADQQPAQTVDHRDAINII